MSGSVQVEARGASESMIDNISQSQFEQVPMEETNNNLSTAAIMSSFFAQHWTQEAIDKVSDRWELKEKEKESFIALGKRLSDIEHPLNVPKDVIRFFKARPKSLKAAETMFRNSIQWRLENGVDTILEDYTPPRLIRDFYPGAVLADLDKDRDPIYVERIGSADCLGMVHRCGAEHMVKHAIWIRELISKGDWIKDYERRTGRPPCQILAIQDLEGLSMSHLDRQLISAFQEITRLDQDNYPEAAKKIISINAPFIFRLAWSLVKHFFDHNVAAKMVFASKAHSEKVLAEYVDLKVLPKEFSPYGQGTAIAGQNSNFKGGPLPPVDESEGEVDSAQLGSKRRETASDSESSYSPLARSTPVAQEERSVQSKTSQKSLPVWKKTPVRSYMRKQEEKKDNRKRNEIREIRVVAANRLQPKQLSSSQQDRLIRLQEAKGRRNATAGPADEMSLASGKTGRASMDGLRKSVSENVTEYLQNHNRPTRFLVISFLLSSLLFLLHPELLQIQFGFDLLASPRSFVWWRGALQVLALLLYTLLIAVVHFLTCDVALVYAYNALDLGKKTGKEVKRFYSDKIRIVVAGVSLGIYVVSFSKAIARVILGYGVEKTWAAVHWVLAILSPQWGRIRERISEAVEDISVAVGDDVVCNSDNEEDMLNSTKQAICASLSSASQATRQMAESMQYAADSASELVRSLSNSIEMSRLDDVVSSWQLDAFQTARMFFSYTVVFLLIFLFLFNLVASSALLQTKKRPQKSNDTTRSQSASKAQAKKDEQSPSEFLRELEAKTKAPPTHSLQASPFTDDDENRSISSNVSSISGVSQNSSRSKRSLRLFKRKRHRPNLGAVNEAGEDVEN